MKENIMSRFEKWFLKRLCKKLVIQGFTHRQNIIEYYSMIREAAEAEFREDNVYTLNGFMTDCHTAAQSKYYDKGVVNEPK